MDTGQNFDLLTVAQLSEAIGVAEKTLYASLREGKLPGSQRIGRRWLIHKPTFLNWFAKGGRQSD